MTKEQTASSQGKRGAVYWLVLILMGVGFVADLALIVLLLGVGGAVFEGTSGAAPGTVAAWGIALAVSVLAPIFGLRQWRRGRRDLALSGVWLPVLGLMAGALFTLGG